MNVILIYYSHFQIFCHIFTGVIKASFFYYECYAVWLRNMNMCLVFSVLHSRPTSLLSSNRVNVFFLRYLYICSEILSLVIDKKLMFHFISVLPYFLGSL
jgi:hypothetical protein